MVGVMYSWNLYQSRQDRLLGWQLSTGAPRVHSTSARLPVRPIRTSAGSRPPKVHERPARARVRLPSWRLHARSLKSQSQARQPVGNLLLLGNVPSCVRMSQPRRMPPPTASRARPSAVPPRAPPLKWSTIRRSSSAPSPKKTMAAASSRAISPACPRRAVYPSTVANGSRYHFFSVELSHGRAALPAWVCPSGWPARSLSLSKFALDVQRRLTPLWHCPLRRARLASPNL